MPSQAHITGSLLSERAWVEVDFQALGHNIQQLKQHLSASTQLLAVVKADAYGHGALRLAQEVLQRGATWLAVATIPEGIELRQAGISAPILIFGATSTPEQALTIARWQLQPTVCTAKQALALSKALDAPLAIHLKLDTGMSRLGAPWQQALEFVRFVHGLPNLEIASIYSHLAMADDINPTVTQQQQARFEKIIQQIQSTGIPLPMLHLANSAATLSNPGLHYDLVRVGLALYGLYPAEHFKSVINLKPVLQVRARVTQVKMIPAGTGVSYGHQYVAKQPLQLAVVGIGYADGVPRKLSNQMSVLIRGQRLPQIGTITMDQLMVDASNIPDLEEGEVATLLGQDDSEEISADDWANRLGTISYEIVCGFKQRLPRIPINL